MRSLLLFLSFLLLVHGIVAGQDNQTPWPPDPEMLFAEGVDVLAVEMLEINPQSFADNERRVVRVYHEATGEWHEYDYPEDNEGNYTLTQRSDGTFLLMSHSQRAVWVINPKEETIIPLELVCGDKTPALFGEGRWYYVAGEEADRIYLCFTETDERILLPDEIGDIGEETWKPAISPDGRWLVVMTVVSERVNEYEFYSYDLYSYEIVSGQLNYLGRIPSAQMAIYPPAISHNWVSDTRGLISYGPPQESLSKSYYAFDASQPDSLELIVVGWMYDFYRDPPRYEYVLTAGFLGWKTGSATSPESHKCLFWRYDANGVQQHDLGYDCIGANVISGSNRLTTLRVDSSTAEFSTLVTYDLTTRKFTEMVSGEIEWMLAGNYPYVLLLMDDSGKVDLVNSYPMDGLNIDISQYWWLGNVIEDSYLAVLDTTTGKFVYDSSSTHRVSPNGAVFAQWVGDDRFVYSLAWEDPSMTLVVLGEDGADEYTVEGVSQDITELRLSPDGYRMLVYMPQERTTGIADFVSGEVFPLLNSGNTAGYNLFIEWIDENTLTVRVSQRDYSGSAPVVYTVQIP